jgi:hypothetical protein
MENLFLLPTEKPSRLIKSQDNDFVYLNTNAPNWFENNLKTTKQNIYITNDETIKEGDWCYHTLLKGGCVIQSKYDEPNSTMKKIILTTDQDLIADGVQSIPDEFLEWFVKNPSCEEVEVEMNQGRYYDYGGNVHITNAYKIIIPQEEEFKNSNNLQGSIIDSSTENNSFYLPKEKRVMVKFNDDEPMHINSIYGIGNFIISLKEGENIKFQNNGKTFELYIETT